MLNVKVISKSKSKLYNYNKVLKFTNINYKLTFLSLNLLQQAIKFNFVLILISSCGSTG